MRPRDEVIRRLRQHIPEYEKGVGDVYATTRDRLSTATQRAEALAVKFNAHCDPEPYTAIADLVKLLSTLGN